VAQTSRVAHGSRPTAYGACALIAGLGWSALLISDSFGVALPAIAVAIKQTLQALVFGWMVIRAAEGFSGWTGRLLGSTPIVYVGKISYGVYLVHGFAGGLLFGLFGLNSRGMAEPWRLFSLIGVTFAIASLSWHLFEGPLNGLKRFFPYRPRTHPPVATLEPFNP
jgi:peptidoglycan/LPS O-acetylase OafA/YrhL